MQIIKRNGVSQEFDANKIKTAILNAFNSCCPNENTNVIDDMISEMHLWDGITIEEIQDIVIETLRNFGFDDVASAYASYRNKQSHYRELLAKINYQDKFINSSDNAATSSETDANAKAINLTKFFFMLLFSF